MAKIKIGENHPTAVILEENWQQLLRNDKQQTFQKAVKPYIDQILNNTEQEKIQVEPYWHMIQPLVDTRLHEEIKKKINNEQEMKATILEYMETQDKEAIKIFTDGSKEENGKVGGAFYLTQGKYKEKFRMSDNTSIYTAELIAIKQALKFLQKENTKMAHIYSDSLGTLQELERGESKTRPNLLNKVIEMNNNLNKEGTKTKFIWIPSHVGIAGNEEADKLAKEAANHPEIQIMAKKERKEIHKQIDEISNRRWQEQWDEDQNGRHYHSIQREVGKERKVAERISRREEIIMTRLRLGKCRLNYYLHMVGCHPDGLCEECQQPETISHFLQKCRTHRQLHEKLNGNRQHEEKGVCNILRERKSLEIITKYVIEREDMKGRI